MNKIVISGAGKKESISMLIVLFAGVIFSVACFGSYFLTDNFLYLIVGIFIMVFVAVIAKTLITDKKDLWVIDEKGIFSRIYKFGIIPWEDVRSVRKLKAFNEADKDPSLPQEDEYYVEITLTKEEKYLQEILKNSKGDPVLQISYPGKIDPDNLLEVVRFYISKKK